MDRKQLQELCQRHNELLKERRSWEHDWKTLARYFLPRKCRFIEQGERSNEGGLRSGSLDSTGIYAMRDLAAGLQGGMTSPARPWFRLALEDKSLEKSRAVHLWLDKVEETMRSVFRRSNFYTAVHQLYGELGTFGTGFIFALADKGRGIRFQPLTVGEYCLDTNEYNLVDTCFRSIDMTLRQMVRRFGLENLPDQLKNMWGHQTNWSERFRVVHAVYPRNDRDPDKLDDKNMAFASVYYMDGSGSGGSRGAAGNATYPHLLSEGGYTSFPGFGPRWDVTAGDVYGRSAGMDAVPDCVLLNSMTASMLKALHKEVDPPMVAPSSLKQVNLLPGGSNFVDINGGSGQQVYPAMQLRHNIQGTAAAIAQIQQQVREGLFNNLFRMLLNSDRRQITAREVATLEEEKLILVGPVLERLHDELLTPLINRTFDLMVEEGMVPPWPEELNGQQIKVEFVSILAVAQKMVSTGAVEQYVGFVGQVGQMDPAILDVVNTDKMADVYADYLGVPAEIIRSQEERDKMREERAKAQEAAMQQQQQMQALALSVQSAKELGQTPVGGDNALSAMMGAAANA